MAKGSTTRFENGALRPTRKPRVFVTDEDFIRGWQGADTLEAALELLGGMSKCAAYCRAVRLRKLGIPLRRFPSLRGGGTDCRRDQEAKDFGGSRRPAAADAHGAA